MLSMRPRQLKLKLKSDQELGRGNRVGTHSKQRDWPQQRHTAKALCEWGCVKPSVEGGRDRTKLERQRETRPCLCPYHTTIQPLSCRQSVRTDMVSLDRGMGGFLMKVTGKEIFLLMVKVNSCSYLLTGSCLAVSQELQGRVQVWRWIQTLIISNYRT